jgi:hypothetical protein
MARTSFEDFNWFRFIARRVRREDVDIEEGYNQIGILSVDLLALPVSIDMSGMRRALYRRDLSGSESNIFF